MTDIRTLWPRGRTMGDYAPAPDGRALDARCDLASAVMISLFTHRRADPDDVLPDDPRGLAAPLPPRSNGDPRGWWGDSLTGRRIGSRLWLLAREKSRDSVRARAVAYAEEALAWLIEDGVASAIAVESGTSERADLLALAVRIQHPRHGPLNLAVTWPWRQAASCAASAATDGLPTWLPPGPSAALTFDGTAYEFSMTTLSWDART